ncbi:hypothetical protein M0804_007912 [Polistes exclamans]|nr:hypothetical protein M0804_007912 [Polistes exclamans]
MVVVVDVEVELEVELEVEAERASSYRVVLPRNGACLKIVCGGSDGRSASGRSGGREEKHPDTWCSRLILTPEP